VIEETHSGAFAQPPQRDALFVRYNPVVQPVLRPDAKDLTGFLSATAAAKDPTAGGVLQSLGLALPFAVRPATAMSSSNRSLDCAMSNRVMREVMQRYCRLRDADAVAHRSPKCCCVGQGPVPGPFDAMLDHTAETTFDSRSRHTALALAQISLRPCAAQGMALRAPCDVSRSVQT